MENMEFKECPKCGNPIPKHWNRHEFNKKENKPCGWGISEDKPDSCPKEVFDSMVMSIGLVQETTGMKIESNPEIIPLIVALFNKI